MSPYHLPGSNCLLCLLLNSITPSCRLNGKIVFFLRAANSFCLWCFTRQLCEEKCFPPALGLEHRHVYSCDGCWSHLPTRETWLFRCPRASTVPAGDDSSVLRSGSISPLILYFPKTCTSGTSPCLSLLLLSDSIIPCLLLPWNQNTAAAVMIVQVIVAGIDCTAVVAVVARVPASAGLPPSINFQSVLESRVAVAVQNMLRFCSV